MSETISAIASLLWPLIVLAVIMVFRGPLSRVIRSTEQRDFTIKIGGEEVSVGQLSRQQMDLMSDLQEQVSALRKRVDELDPRGASQPGGLNRAGPGAGVAGNGIGPGSILRRAAPPAHDGARGDSSDTELADLSSQERSTGDRPTIAVDAGKAPWERLEQPATQEEPAQAAGTPSPRAPGTDAALGRPPLPPGPFAGQGGLPNLPDSRPKPAGVLWIDDHPQNNALQLDQLERKGVMVDTARSTREALQKLTGQRYQLIVSDMERTEDGRLVPDAGLELVRTVRAFDRETPLVIYSTGPTAKVYGTNAEKAGATMVTGSWYQLSEELRRIGLL